jgi:signal transduction histidine kinase
MKAGGNRRAYGTKPPAQGQVAEPGTRAEAVALAVAQASQLEATFEAIADGIMVFDAEGRVVRSNPAARHLLEMEGFPPGFFSMPIETLAEALQPRDARGRPLEHERLPVQRVLHGETLTGHDAVDVLYRLPSGRDILLNISGAPVRDEGAEISGAVCVYRDVTERRRLEDERAHMLNIVSHELKSPLTSLTVRAQVLRRALDRKGLAEVRTVGAIERDVERMTRLVNDLVEAARFERSSIALHIEQCDLAQLCQQAADEQMAASGRTVALHLPEETVLADVDCARIGQVLSNLLNNALKYSPAGAAVDLRLLHAGDEVRVAVRDEGPGISPDAMPHLFERFYRVPAIKVQHGTGVGLGLGLHISKMLVERHGGRMGVESEPGQGATFWFTLPERRGR